MMAHLPHHNPPGLNYSEGDDLSGSGHYYQTAGYWLMSTQHANGMFPVNRIAATAFDPSEELVWTVTTTGQLTAYYGSTLEQYITLPVMPFDSKERNSSPEECHLKSIFPSSRYSERIVYMLAENAIYAYSKFGMKIGYSTSSQMRSMECMAACRATPSDNQSDFERFFCGGLQNELLELDATSGPAWGSLVRTIDMGPDGAVILKPFALGLCSANTKGRVKIVDPRAVRGIVRSFEAHSGEISDMCVLDDAYTLVTCGWSRMTDGSLRVDRMVNIFDLRFGRSQAPLSTLVDPGFVRACSSLSPLPCLIAASQFGYFQTLEMEGRNLDPASVGNVVLSGTNYDRLVSLAMSSNGSCLLFGTDAGSLRLYSNNPTPCRFNEASLETEFASPLPLGLLPADVEHHEPTSLPPTGSHALARLAGANLRAIAESAGDSAIVQSLGATLFQQSPPPPPLGPPNGGALVATERRRLQAIREALAVANKPISDFEDGAGDDGGFSLSAVPFIDVAPPCQSAELVEWIDAETGRRRDGTFSDWPHDLCGVINRSMLAVDPDLISQATSRGVVGKPKEMGAVWFPYSEAAVSSATSDLS